MSDLDSDLTVDVVAMSDRDDYEYPSQVRYEIADNEQSAYAPGADFINRSEYDVLSVQHEFGIFGGESGSHLLNLVREAKMPIVTTLHTVLREPSPSQKSVLDELMQLSERVVVMSKKAIEFLTDDYGVSRDKIDLIPHGIPSFDKAAGADLRSKLGIKGPMILTFGLLSPDKGIQYVIQAMPKIVAEHPGATYVIVGATHPHIRASSGEVYRESLVKLAEELGVATNVRFVDRFVEAEELIDYLAAMDIYVTPYLNQKQITSGTLAYAVGAGKAVISTRYWYAEELLADGRGMLVPFADAEAIADAVLDVQSHPVVRQKMARRAAEFGKQMLWPEVGKSYIASFERAMRDSTDRMKTIVQKPALVTPSSSVLPDLRFDHLFDLCDDTGMLQHATFTIPNRSEGYCVDDNARAVLLTAYVDTESFLTPALSLLQSRCLSFVQHSYNAKNGRFRNFMSYDRRWLEEAGSEDSHGRTLWALGAIVSRSKNRGRREAARSLFEKGSNAMFATTSPRTWAYGVLAASEFLGSQPNETSVLALRDLLAKRLHHIYEEVRTDDWQWFEESLAYANARLPQSLIIGGIGLKDRNMMHAGLEALRWLMKVQTSNLGQFAPIGTNGFYAKGGECCRFDQQPIEAAASVSACLSAYRATGDPAWFEEAQRSFRWFMGDNELHQPLYDRSTGGCHDGLHAARINENQGAESTLSFLCALAELRHAVASSATLLSKESRTSGYEVR